MEPCPPELGVSVSPVRPFVVKPGAFVAAAALLFLTGCASGPAVDATGETTEVTVQVEGMQFIPDVVEVPVGDELVITLENTGTVMHDLVMENGTRTAHIGPGESQTIEVGVISGDMDGWCSVSNHRDLGMALTIIAVETDAAG